MSPVTAAEISSENDWTSADTSTDITPPHRTGQRTHTRRTRLLGCAIRRGKIGSHRTLVRLDATRNPEARISRQEISAQSLVPSAPMPASHSMVDRLALTNEPGDVFVSTAPTDARHVFGGLLIGQALRAAQLTVDATRPAHSLHASFVVAGAGGEHVRYEVERTRDGGSFGTRRVVARQSRGVVLVMTADFHDDEPGLEYELPA